MLVSDPPSLWGEPQPYNCVYMLWMQKLEGAAFVLHFSAYLGILRSSPILQIPPPPNRKIKDGDQSCCRHEIFSWGGIFSPFMQMYLIWGPNIAQHISLTAIGQKKASPHVIGTEWRARSKPSVQYLNTRIYGQNLRSTPRQTQPKTQYFFKNSKTG